jgi:hypothetical protein
MFSNLILITYKIIFVVWTIRVCDGCLYILTKEGKAIPVTGCEGP